MRAETHAVCFRAGVWITTSGTYGGVAKLVGKAVRDLCTAADPSAPPPIVLLGVTLWAQVNGLGNLAVRFPAPVSTGRSAAEPVSYL